MNSSTACAASGHGGGAGTRRRRAQRGAKLLGLVVALALLALATWGYLQMRTEPVAVNPLRPVIAEVFASIDPCKAVVERVVQTTQAPELTPGVFVCDGGAAAGVRISPHLLSLAVSERGVIRVLLNFRTLPDLAPTATTLTLVPLVSGGAALAATDVRKAITGWRCGAPQDGTTIPANLLPPHCQG